MELLCLTAFSVISVVSVISDFSTWLLWIPIFFKFCTMKEAKKCIDIKLMVFLEKRLFRTIG